MGTALSNIMNANPARFVVVQIHISDVYARSWGTSRLTFYGSNGLPTTVQDGILRRIGAYPATQYQADFNARVNVSSNVPLTLTPRHLTGGQFEIDVSAAVEPGTTARTFKLVAMQICDQYPTPNTHWRNCHIGEAVSLNFTSVQPGTSVSHTFPLTFSGTTWTTLSWRTRLKVIVFAQNTGAYPAASEIYQTAQLEWEELMPADLNNSGEVGLPDLAIMLSNFGIESGASSSQGDVDDDGDVDIQDMARLLADFGT